MAKLSPLRRRMIEDMTVRNLSPATQRSYLNAVSKFSRYFGRSPDHLGLEDVHAFQVHLVATGISWPALNQIVCPLRFFYGVTLGHSTIPERIAYARQPRKLPFVLSADEVVSFLEAIPSLKSRIALTTVYATGLRVSQVVSFQRRRPLELLAGPELDCRQTERKPLGRHGEARMHQDAALRAPCRLTRKANQIRLLALDAEFRRVVEDEDRSLYRRYAPARRLEMTAKNIRLIDPLVGEEREEAFVLAKS
ncbi:phage integrase N-terminal SAM-like domain-containing protein [Bradyrhizobium sp. USDA 10063]